MKFRKKPVVVEAVQWFPHIFVSGVCFEFRNFTMDSSGRTPQNSEQRPYVVTIYGQRAYLSAGDWVITESDGLHHYPCKPEIFQATYEAVE